MDALSVFLPSERDRAAALVAEATARHGNEHFGWLDDCPALQCRFATLLSARD